MTQESNLSARKLPSGRRPTEAVKIAVLLGRNLSIKETADALGKTQNAVRCAKRKLVHGLLKWPIERYCASCFAPTVEAGVCTRCGAEQYQEVSPSVDFEGHSEPVSQARRDGGLGSDREDDFRLIGWLRKERGYSPGEGLRMCDYENLSRVGDDALTRKVLVDVVELAGIRDGDFVVSEQAGRLVRKLCLKAKMRRCEITRGWIHSALVIPILREMYRTYPTRIQLDVRVADEVRSDIQTDLEVGFRRRGE